MVAEPQASGPQEVSRRISCFGGDVEMRVSNDRPDGAPASISLETASMLLRAAHVTLTRFDPASELSRLNADPRPTVPAGPLLRRFVAAARWAAIESGGLVDAALLGELEDAGYDRDIDELERAASPNPGELEQGVAAEPGEMAEGAPARLAIRWEEIEVDDRAATITRPPGIRLDSGGLAKGLMADRVASLFGGHSSYAIDVAGDIRVGGYANRARAVEIADPFSGPAVGELSLAGMAVATSGVTARRWSRDGIVAHHLLDPATGYPADTGLVQVSAVAPTALRAEVHAKAALLSGPEGADRWLGWGGVIVTRDGGVREVGPGPDTR